MSGGFLNHTHTHTHTHTLRGAHMCFSHTSLNSAVASCSQTAAVLLSVGMTLSVKCKYKVWQPCIEKCRLMFMFNVGFVVNDCVSVCSNVQGDSQTSICITIEPGLLLKGDILVRMNLTKPVKKHPSHFSPQNTK